MERNISTRLDIDKYLDRLKQIQSLSNDPYTKVACILLDDSLDIVGIGYNDKPKMWVQKYPYEDRELKNKYIIHAEINAVIDAGSNKACVAIVTLFPCTHCMKALLAKGITTLYYHDIRFNEDASEVFAMCGMCGVEVIRF